MNQDCEELDNFQQIYLEELVNVKFVQTKSNVINDGVALNDRFRELKIFYWLTGETDH